jgi:hypothetical protein
VKGHVFAALIVVLRFDAQTAACRHRPRLAIVAGGAERAVLIAHNQLRRTNTAVTGTIDHRCLNGELAGCGRYVGEFPVGIN